MTQFFADAHYWIALTNPRDADHTRARAMGAILRGSTIHTSDEVLTEYLAAMSNRGPWLRTRAARMARQLLDDPDVCVWPQTRDGLLDALQMYAERQDKGYSLVDCSSMILMRQEGVHDVLTRDRHFEQEGFAVLIRD